MPETVFNGGARWTILRALGDHEHVERFFGSYQVIPSRWLQKEFQAALQGRSRKQLDRILGVLSHLLPW
jgi:hypothetical protein